MRAPRRACSSPRNSAGVNKGKQRRDEQGRAFNRDGRPRKAPERKAYARDELGRALRADGTLANLGPRPGARHPNFGRRWTNAEGRGMRQGGKPGRQRAKTISERLLEGFGRVLTAERAAQMARNDPFRAADLAVRIEQAPVLRELQAPPTQYWLDFGAPPIEGESVRVDEPERVERAP